MTAVEIKLCTRDMMPSSRLKRVAQGSGSIKLMFPYLRLFRLPESNVSSFDFIYLAVSESIFFKIWYKIVPLSPKLCLLRYSGNDINIGTELTLSSVNKMIHQNW